MGTHTTTTVIFMECFMLSAITVLNDGDTRETDFVFEERTIHPMFKIAYTSKHTHICICIGCIQRKYLQNEKAVVKPVIHKMFTYLPTARYCAIQ